LGLAYAGIDAGTALTLGADADRCLVGAILPGVGSVSGSTNRWLTACRNRRFGVSTSALGFEYNRGDSEWCYLHNYCWNSRFYSGMAAGISQELYYSDWGRWQLLMYLQSQFPKVALGWCRRHLIFWGYFYKQGSGVGVRGQGRGKPIPNRYDACSQILW